MRRAFGEEEELIPLDPTCPKCRKHCGVGEIHDGGEHHCFECDELLVAVSYGDEMLMHLVGGSTSQARTGRQRTRARWRRQARR